MSSERFTSGGGGGGSSSFRTADGGIDWPALAKAVIGGPILAFIGGIIAINRGFGQAAWTAANGFVGWLADMIHQVFGVQQSVIEGVWLGATADVQQFGALGFVVGILVAGATAYALQQGVSYLVE